MKKLLLEISQNSRENTCARDSFLNKVSGAKAGVTVSNKYEIHLKKKICCRKNLEGVAIGVL